jgi:hypothetical protein
MRWEKIIGVQVLALLLPVSLAVPADEVEVIRSNKSVISIYSYGGAAKTRLAPELPDRANFGKKSTAALSDVVATPELSLSLPVPPSQSVGLSITPPPFKIVPDKAPKAASGRQGGFQPTQSAPSNLATAVQTVVLVWEASPDSSVAGYLLYSGTASHQYTVKQMVGNQTSARVTLDQPTMYFAVTAYTADGLESVPSAELRVGPDSVPP